MPHALSNCASRARCAPLALRIRPSSACAAGGCAQASALRVSPRVLSDRASLAASRACCAAKHNPVPLMQRNPPRLRPSGSGMRRDARLAAHGCAAPGASRSPRAEHIPVQLVRRDRPRLPWLAAGCALDCPRVCHIRRDTITASRARARAACTRRPPRCHGRRRNACRAAHVCAASGGSRSPRAEHAPVPLVLRDRPAAMAGSGMRAEWPAYVQHPVPHDCSEPSTSMCRSRDAIPSRLPRRAAGMCVARPTCVPHPAPRDRSEPRTSPCRPRDATAPARHGRRRVVSRVATRVPHPVHRNRSEPSTCPCRSRDATAPTCHSWRRRCAGRPTRVPHPVRRNRSEPSTSPCRSSDPTAPSCHGQRRDVRWTIHACAASSPSRSPRDELVPVPLARRDQRANDAFVPLVRTATAPACHGRRRTCTR
jgi:hypothetical protein